MPGCSFKMTTSTWGVTCFCGGSSACFHSCAERFSLAPLSGRCASSLLHHTTINVKTRHIYWTHKQKSRWFFSVGLKPVCWWLPPVTEVRFSFSIGTQDTLGCLAFCIFRYCSLARRNRTLRSFRGTAAGFCASSRFPVRTQRCITFHHPVCDSWYDPDPGLFLCACWNFSKWFVTASVSFNNTLTQKDAQ